MNKGSLILFRLTAALAVILAMFGLAVRPALAETPPGSVIVDHVWEDLDMNGLWGVTEPDFPGVTVNLFTCAGAFVATRSTNTGGDAFFISLPAGDYFVEFIAPAGFVFSPQNVGSDDAHDSDPDPLTGRTACFTLAAGAIEKTVHAGLYKFTPPPPPPTQPGTGTPGYWKNHPEAWPVEQITIGGVVFSKADALFWLGQNDRHDKTITLFRALVSAKLNVLIGNESSCVDSTILAADAWMATYRVGTGVRASTAAWRVGEPLYMTLDAYNNGLLCAPPRD
ncbi:MAG: hypothetical protein L0Z70_07970 [Chloroflexi bacterium]|nr:hypothetical protein [Chloroflexota bacterium]